MRARPLMMTAVVVIAAAIAWPGVAGAQSEDEDGRDDPRTITVSATGLVRGTPDVLDLTVGVETRDRSAAEALKRNNQLANRLIDVLRDAGVDKDDIQTSNLSVSPNYDDDGDITGYGVSNLVDARLRDFDKAGEVVDAATEIAGDEVIIHGVFFSFDDNTELVAKARTEAVKRARTQAEQLAEAADVDLGDLLSLTEDTENPGPVFDARAATEEGDAAAPIEPGSETLSVQVTLVYEIK
jgi:uncharacterized protein